MKQNILRWLGCSLILLFSFSCKKEKGSLEDLYPGRFDFVYVLNNNSIQDTITGELSGPYIKSGLYIFRIRQKISMDKQLKAFTVGAFKSVINGYFIAQVNTDATIIYENHSSDYLLVRFESGDTLSGSLHLTRKE
jgi:hypothetical protein